jgi:hypothetical protein
MSRKYLITLAVLIISTEPAFALRCGTKLVDIGDHITKVEHMCGEPVSIQFSTAYRSGIPRHTVRRSARSSLRSSSDQELLIHDRSAIEVQLEEWTYNFGPTRFMRAIRFENGVVVKIESLGYGY